MFYMQTQYLGTDIQSHIQPFVHSVFTQTYYYEKMNRNGRFLKSVTDGFSKNFHNIINNFSPKLYINQIIRD